MVEASLAYKKPSEYSKEDLQALSTRLIGEIDIKDRSYRWKTYKQCFIAADLVKHLLNKGVRF